MEYLELLRDAHRQVGSPPMREISRAIGMSSTTAHSALTGRNRPGRAVVRNLIDYFIAEGATTDRAAFLAAYAADAPPPVLRIPVPTRYPQDVAEANDAIRELATAIRLLAEAIHAGRCESQKKAVDE